MTKYIKYWAMLRRDKKLAYMYMLNTPQIVEKKYEFIFLIEAYIEY